MKLEINKKTFMYTTIKLIVMYVYIILTSCKSSKSNCDAYGNNNIKNDSIKIKVEHCHIEKENYCYYSIDTIKFVK